MRYSDFTQDDLQAATDAMKAAYDVYLQRKSEYDYSISVGHDGYAKRNRLEPMNEAWEAYENAKEYYDNILDSIQSGQEIEITNTVANSFNQEESDTINNINWGTVAIAGGALLVIILIYKIL